jgi:hypothetical protein
MTGDNALVAQARIQLVGDAFRFVFDSDKAQYTQITSSAVRAYLEGPEQDRLFSFLRRSIMSHLRRCVGICLLVLVSSSLPAQTADRPTAALSDYFPPPEEQGGWRTLLPAEGEPDDSQKARIRDVGGVDWDLLKAAWD